MTPAPAPPRLPRRRDWRIGCVGAGFIMRDCHLVAYREIGLNPVALASRTPAAAREVAALRGVPVVHDTPDALLADPAVEVLDLAVPPQHQPDLIRRAVAAGAGRLRGILAQKPLALTVADARDVVARCAAAGVVLAVNQNMRWDSSVRGLKHLLGAGVLGEPVFASIEMRAVPHWMPWAAELPSLSTFVMSIHHLDTFRYWLGTPDRVLASTRPDPRTAFPHRDGINLYILEYDNGPRAAAWDDVWAGPSEVSGYRVPSFGTHDVTVNLKVDTHQLETSRFVRWRVEGTDGLARGSVGWPGWPERVPSTLDYSTRTSAGWVRPGGDGVWFPDAFAGPMTDLLCAIEDGSEPAVSGRDNVETVALCAAVFAAATEHRVTTAAEFLS